MNIYFSRKGGLIVTSKNYDTTTTGFQFCIFPANVRFAKSTNVVVVFGIGISFTRRA